MRLKPTKRGLLKVQEEKPVEKKRKDSKNTLPPDEYRPMFTPIRFLVRETHSSKDPTKVIKQYVELSVKRFNDDEALPFVWIQMYQESEFYTGYLKGKTVYLPLEVLDDLIENLQDLDNKADDLHITV